MRKEGGRRGGKLYVGVRRKKDGEDGDGGSAKWGKSEGRDKEGEEEMLNSPPNASLREGLEVDEEGRSEEKR